MTTFERVRQLEKMGMEQGIESLHEGVDSQEKMRWGIGRLLSELWNMNGSDPVAIAIEAMEDANHHKEAEILRELHKEWGMSKREAINR